MLQRQGQVDGRSGITADPTVGLATPPAGAAVGGDMSAAKSAGLLRMPRAACITSWFCIVGSLELSAMVVSFGFEGEFE